jgi:LmbE family N-acetylglucosaminyl deacetylase
MNDNLPSGRPIFVSPHADDAVLSCGGTIAALAEAGRRPLIATVFAGEVVDEMAGGFARWKHARWKLQNVDEVRRQRAAEDVAAATAVGADLVWLGLPDAIYRGERYTSDQELYSGRLALADVELAYLVATEILSLPGTTPESDVFVPLGIGSHADHLVCFVAAQSLADRNVRVLAWEDVPYVIHTPEGLQRRLAEASSVQEGPTLAIDRTLERRLDGIAAYSTQVPVIFRFTDDWRATVIDHARSMGDGRPAERFWNVLPTRPESRHSRTTSRPVRSSVY